MKLTAFKTTKPAPSIHSSSVPAESRILFTNVGALRLWIKELEDMICHTAATAEYTHTITGGLYHFENARSPVIGIARASGQDLAAARTMLAMIEASPEFKAADALITPLLEYEAEVRANEEAKRRDLHQKRMNVEQAAANAKARALANLENDAEFAAAKKALDEAL